MLSLVRIRQFEGFLQSWNFFYFVSVLRKNWQFSFLLRAGRFKTIVMFNVLILEFCLIIFLVDFFSVLNWILLHNGVCAKTAFRDPVHLLVVHLEKLRTLTPLDLFETRGCVVYMMV